MNEEDRDIDARLIGHSDEYKKEEDKKPEEKGQQERIKS